MSNPENDNPFMDIKKDVSLKSLNTFGLDIKAAFFAEVRTIDDLIDLLKKPEYRNIPKLILGGGSNVLFTRDFPGLVIKNVLKGKEIVREDQDHIWIKSMSGEVWHELVLFAINKNLGGIENLSLIPGSVGAAPIQNIGAYGVELKEVFEELEALNVETGQLQKFSATECRFGYRDSVFKQELKGKYFITSVVLRLNKHPEFNISYGAIKETLEEMGGKDLTVKAVSDAVCKIRSSKLPDPKEIGNAGSFFKNPEISADQYNVLKGRVGDIPGYPLPDGNVKVPAGWLIEQCGWKGKRVGNTGSHKFQSLVLVNYGGARGEEIKDLANAIQKSVKEKFDIELLPEVNIL